MKNTTKKTKGLLMLFGICLVASICLADNVSVVECFQNYQNCTKGCDDKYKNSADYDAARTCFTNCDEAYDKCNPKQE